MRAAGWDVARLAARMGCKDAEDFALNCFTIDLLIAIPGSPHEPTTVLGEVEARRLARAFGTSPHFWQEMHAKRRAWLARQEGA